MPTPKSQVKILAKQGRTEIQYESNLDASQYYIFELTRAALRDVGKFVTKAFKTAFYQRFDKHSGKAGKATKYKVISGKATTAPRVQIGLRASDKSDGFYAYFQEMGTSTGIPRLGLLQQTVKNNVAEIVKIESQYLDGLKEEADRLEREINEKDYEGDADDS